MNGLVDKSMRALLDVSVAAAKGAKRQVITVWIDTAFNGGLVIPRQPIERRSSEPMESSPCSARCCWQIES